MERPAEIRFASNVSEFSDAQQQEIAQFSSNSGVMRFDNVTYQNVTENQFIKNKKLGRGTFGHVFEATFANNGKKVAVKECIARMDSGNSVLLGWAKRMGRELEINSMSHQCENLLKCHGYIVTPEFHVFLYLEVMPMSLGQLSRAAGKISDRFVGKFAIDVITGMHYLRQLKMVHRDLKPDNMLIDKFGTVKLADFGFMGYVMEMSVVSNTTGTIIYTAPEVFTTDPRNSPWKSSVDVWSFAISMLELLRGEHPLEDQQSQFLSIMQVINADIPELTKKEAPAIYDLINSCLNRDPSRRPRIKDLPKHAAIKRLEEDENVKEELREWLSQYLSL
ncbi:hypothetical protein L596_019220 [Steinernema carpocapsae]|uniref:mitogen-activated protein kinase kinase n=1 Tax=Steinernema carpocapsae TaxID=34508 RepID=A0A4U5MPN9_STECR|nr:hypothetical protein L596_019220 [Steinernema carpocapsae]